MKERYLECGKIVATHGVRGEVKVEPWCDEPGFLLDFPTLYLGRERRPVTVERARVQKNMVLLKLAGVEDMESAVTLRGNILYIDRDDVTLREGQYFIQDLIGLEVWDADTGRRYGRLTQVSQTGANDVYHIRFDDGGERLVPAIPQVVLSTDLEAGRMTIRPLPGLFEGGEELL